MTKLNFTKFKDIDNIISIKLNNIIFNNHIKTLLKEHTKIATRLNIFNNRAINLSGSTIINLYNNLINNTTCDIASNDIDIYIDLQNISELYLNDIILRLFTSGYRLTDNKNKSSKVYLEYKKLVVILYELFFQRYYDNNASETNIHPEKNKYFSLAKYIYKVITLENIYTNQKIDLIFMKCSIQNLLLKSFDLDIIKNYYNRGYLYIFNTKAIKNKIATITYTHFTDRIINNIYEFNNFIMRYMKYTQRGYKIFIDDNEINLTFINNIVKLIQLRYDVNLNTTSFKDSKIYVVNHISSFIKIFYLKTYFIDENLIKNTCHPSRIQKILDIENDLENF